MNNGPKLNANQINKHIRQFGVIITRGAGYYYWIDTRDNMVVADAESVMVYRASDLPLDRWIGLAKEAAKMRN